MKTRFAIFLGLFGLLSASAVQANDAVFGALIGSGVGAVVGNSVGGRDGAIIGGALGAATGVVLVSERDHRRSSRHVHMAPRVIHREVIYRVPPPVVRRPVIVERQVVYVPRHHRHDHWRNNHWRNDHRRHYR